mgnify:FL=1
MKVEIKQRALPTGNISLYIEYYEPGFRKKEALGLFLMPETAHGAKKHNKEVMKQAMAIRADRMLHPIDFDKEKEIKEQKKQKAHKEICRYTWLEWCNKYNEWSEECGNNSCMMDHKMLVRRRIEEFLNSMNEPDLRLDKVTTAHISALYDYMREYKNERQCKDNDNHLAGFTLMLFGQTINAIFNKAVRDNVIPFNPVQGLSQLEKFHAPDKHREFLTAEELQRFLAAKPETESEWQVQHAFGFSCMTGLRRSDIFNLKWNNIKSVGDTKVVSIIQQKTKQPVTIPLNDMALSLLPEKTADQQDDFVFHIPKGHDILTKYISRIREKAGIDDKHLSYHCSRHTAATLAITAGAELYSVSKILGHQSIVSTQVYADVVMDAKVETVNLTDGVFV